MDKGKLGLSLLRKLSDEVINVTTNDVANVFSKHVDGLMALPLARSVPRLSRMFPMVAPAVEAGAVKNKNVLRETPPF